MKRLFDNVKRNLANIPSKGIGNRKILVIESVNW